MAKIGVIGTGFSCGILIGHKRKVVNSENNWKAWQSSPQGSGAFPNTAPFKDPSGSTPQGTGLLLRKAGPDDP